MRKRPLCGFCLLLVLLICLCRAAGIPVFGSPRLPSDWFSRLESGMNVRVTGTVAGRQLKQKSIQYILKNNSVLFGNRSVPVSKILFTSTSKDKLSVGTRLTVHGKLAFTESPGNPGQFDSRSYYACQGIYLTLWEYDRRILSEGRGLREYFTVLRENTVRRQSEIMSPESASVLSSMILGDRSLLDENTRLDFQLSGVIHILCISGLHITLLGVAAFRLCLLLLSRMRPRGARRLSAALAGSLILWYGIFTGGSISTLRALLMFGVYLGAILLKRSYDTLSALSLSAILLLLSHPGYLFYADFLLSFSAVLGSAVLQPLLGRRLKPLFQKLSGRKRFHPLSVLSYLIRQTVSWLSITLIMLPLSAWYFYEIPLLGLPANLLLLPFVSFILEGGIIGTAAGMICRPAGAALLLPVDFCLRLFSLLTGYIRRLPGSTLICGQPTVLQIFLYYLLLLCFCLGISDRKKVFLLPAKIRKNTSLSGTRPVSVIRHLRISLLPLFAACILFLRPQAPFSLTMLDVGQGDALVLRQGYGSVFLCDGGSSDVKNVGTRRLLPYLKQQGIRRIECVFLSHGDADHLCGIEELLESIVQKKTSLRIRTVSMPFWMKDDAAGKRLCRLAAAAGTEVIWSSAGDYLVSASPIFAKNKLSIEILHPSPKSDAQEGNAGSMVLSVTYGDFSALLTGDLEAEGENEILPALSHYDYLKAAHHGSRYSTSRAFLSAVSPSVVTVSAPKKSKYGHPHRETLGRIRRENADCFITKDCGAITAWTDGKEMKILTFRNGSGKKE